jgi:hypothetical protein
MVVVVVIIVVVLVVVNVRGGGTVVVMIVLIDKLLLEVLVVATVMGGGGSGLQGKSVWAQRSGIRKLLIRAVMESRHKIQTRNFCVPKFFSSWRTPDTVLVVTSTRWVGER